MKRIIIETRDGWFYASQGPGYGFCSGKTIAEAIGALIERNPEMFDIEVILPVQTSLRMDELFTVDQRKELLAVYIEKTVVKANIRSVNMASPGTLLESAMPTSPQPALVVALCFRSKLMPHYVTKPPRNYFRRRLAFF